MVCGQEEAEPLTRGAHTGASGWQSSLFTAGESEFHDW